jgi:NADPH oxidase 5
MSPGYLTNNAPRLVSYGVFAIVNVLLFAGAVHTYAPHGPLVQLARGCGAVMNFNAAFCLLPMMRLFISRLRRTRFARFLALEDSVGFHRLSGYTMFGAALVHTVAYLVIYTRAGGPLMTRLTSSLANQTGVALIGVFVVLWTFAVGPVRRRVPFELFFVTHFLGVVLVVLLLLHSPSYWKWFLVAGSGYLADRAVRFYRLRRPSLVTLARRLPSQVTELTIARPPDGAIARGISPSSSCRWSHGSSGIRSPSAVPLNVRTR